MKVRDHHETCHGDAPLHPEGREWTHVLVLHDGSTVYADTATEVLSELLPGYLGQDDAAQLAGRVRHAEQVAGLVQRLYLEQASQAGAFDADEPANAGLVDILQTPKGVSLALSLPETPDEAADWLPAVPLVLVTTRYAPHQPYAPIGGNVVWLDPTTEQGYLLSLRASGVFSYWTAGSDTPAPGHVH